MKVKTWHCQFWTGRKIKGPKDFIDEIEKNASTASLLLGQSIDLKGHYFILGGRRSITSAFKGFGGSFKSVDPVNVSMVRISKGAFSKVYTIIKVSNEITGGPPVTGWSHLPVRGDYRAAGSLSSTVQFDEIVQAMWEAEGKLMGQVIDAF